MTLVSLSTWHYLFILPRTCTATDGGLPGSPFYKQGMNPKSSIVSNVMDAKPSLQEQGYASREEKATHLEKMRQIPPHVRRQGKEDAAMEYAQGRPGGSKSAEDAAEDSLGPTGKRFTESLHERKNNGKFEESSNKKKPERN